MSRPPAAPRRRGGRALAALGLALLCGGLSGGAFAQTPPKKYPLFSTDDFISAMKITGRAFGSVTTAIAANDVETAKAQLARSREQLAITVTFWRDRQRDDALKMLRDTLTRMDDLDVALSAASVDQASATAVARQVASGCQSCHQAYREQDPATKAFRFKLDSAR